MNKFGLIYKHYLKRMTKTPLLLGLQIALPLFIINVMVGGDFSDDPIVAGAIWAGIATNFAVSFAIFSGEWATGYIFDDLKEKNHFRLLAAPVTEKTYRTAALAASMTVGIFCSLTVMGVTTLLQPIVWPNVPMLIVTFLLMTILSHSFCYFITVAVKTYKQASPITMITLMGLSILGGGIVMGLDNIINNDVFQFIHDRATPLSWGNRIMAYSGNAYRVNMIDGITSITEIPADWGIVVFNIGLFLGVSALFIILSQIIGRRKKA